ncbi:Nephrocystin-3 [Holothuria leucospilota]|uniref:Nephrocystin-3 n=1 Tax=Holothuria leucospilota TaxID=206669 RepID=A0A9Q0YC46_HOLLE|nr:Nephrocystin-3 [Holothuria leucospilota]
MGTGGSFPQKDEFDLSEEPGVIKRIPIEMNPRRTLGGALRSVGSLGRRPRGVSLRSTFSMELDNVEVEKIRKEFEMYKISKQTEMGDSLKKVNKLENENRRLRAELQALQKTCDKLRAQRDLTLDAEYQALERASSFETERNKVQKQFKIFRESKEREIRDLLKTKERLEKALHLLDPEALIEMKGKDSVEDANGFRELWPSLESEPSIGSSTHFQSIHKAFDQVDTDNCGTVSRAWSNIPPLALTQAFNSFALSSSLVKVFVVISPDLSHDVQAFIRTKGRQLRNLCEGNGKFLSLVCVTAHDDGDMNNDELMNMHEVHRKEIEQSNIFSAIISDSANRIMQENVQIGHLNSPSEKPALFIFHDDQDDSKNMKKQVTERGLATVIQLGTMEEKLESFLLELEKHISVELGSDVTLEKDSGVQVTPTESMEDIQSEPSWDLFGDAEQQEALASALDCVCELGMSKMYDRLNEHILAAGPLPPLLVLGAAGSGKTLLLAKWLSNHVRRNPSCLVLYHFVGSSLSRSASVCSMVQRLTAQIMQIISSSQTMTSDPEQLMEEFPYWLEKVSTKLPDGIVLVIDSGDRFQNCEDSLGWLLDPLPVESRVIISAQVETCPKSWRSWPTVEIKPLSTDEVTEFVQTTCLQRDCFLSEELEKQVLERCQAGGESNHPLFLTVLMSALLSNVRWCEEETVECLQSTSTVQLYRFILKDVFKRYKQSAPVIEKALNYVLVSCNGISESSLVELIPTLTWDVWLPVYQELQQKRILTLKSGVIILSHEQARTAVQLCLSFSHSLATTREELIEYYVQLMRSNNVTFNLCDELPGLLHSSDSLPLLRECISNVSVFRLLYTRGRCAELLTCWQAVGLDRLSVSKEYFDIIKKMEEASATDDIPCPEVANLFEMLGKFSKDLGLLNQAVWAFQRALEIRESIDPDHPTVGRCFYLLGTLHVQWGKFATAESYFKQALLIWETCEEPYQQWITKALDSLVFLYKRQGKFDLVDSLLKRSTAMKKQVSVNEWHAQPQRATFNVKKKIQHLQDQCRGLEGIALAETLAELGVLFLWQQDLEQAKEHLLQSILHLEKLFSVKTLKLLQPLSSLAAVYEAERDLQKAEDIYLRMMNICGKSAEQDLPMASVAARNLAILYKKQGKLDKTEQLYKDLIQRKEKILGDSHPNVATDLLNLAILHCQQENHNLALPLFERALRIYENSYGQNHARVAETLRNLAVLHYERGDQQRAAELYKRANEIKDIASGIGGSRLASRRSSITSIPASRPTSDKLPLR